MLAVVILPLVGLAAGVWLLWGRAVSLLDLGLLGAVYVATGLGITIGYHRMLTHRAFEAPAAVRAFFLVCGAMALQGGPISWAVDHRQHHAFSDRDGDPHSPHAGRGPDLRARAAGLWHAHTGWLFDPDRKRQVARYGKDLLADRVAVAIQRTFVVWVLLGLFLPGVVGFAVTGTWRGAATGLLWGGLVRVFLNHHVTWSINSICHTFGTRPFETDDLATNNWLLALPSFGESWHHNHHVFPSSAVAGVERGQLDPSAWVIRGLELVGLARRVHRPTGAQLARKRRGDGS